MYIPKIFYFSVPTLLLAGMTLASCSSEEIRTEPTPVNPAGQTVELKFTVGANALTKAEDEPENNIESLNLVFFNSNNGSPLFLQEVKAEQSLEDKKIYVANVNINPTKEPDLVVAFVNMPAPTFDNNGIPSNTVEKVLTDDGNLLMSTPRYFDANNKDIFYQAFDYSSSGTIILGLERIAAKISVVKDNPSLPNPTLTNADGQDVQLKLDLLNWGVTATDTETYIIRQIGDYDDMNSELSGWNGWKDSSKNALNWAYSANYSSDDFSNVNLINFQNASNEFGDYCFTHETTRPLGVASTYNSKPSLVITGQYTYGENTDPTTFYRLGSFLLTEDELLGILRQKAKRALKIEGNSDEWIAEKLYLVGVDGNKSPYVSLQTKEEINMADVSKEDGSVFSTTTDLNSYLQSKCGVAEMFEDGKCYFIVPVEHQKFGDKVLYGLVRNHLYNLTIKSIKGLGSGIASENQELGEIDPIENNQESYNIEFNLSIREWTKVEQNIEIERK